MKPKIVERSRRMPNRRYGSLLPDQDVALVLDNRNDLDEFDEFDIILPTVLDHLRTKRIKTLLPGKRRRIGERVAQIEAFQEEVALRSDDLTIELTPQEAEAAAQRLSSISHEKPGSPEDLALATRARAAAYISQNLGLGWHQVCIMNMEQQHPGLPITA